MPAEGFLLSFSLLMRGFFEGLWSYGAKGLSQMQLLFWGLGQLGLLENTGLLGVLGLLGLLKKI